MIVANNKLLFCILTGIEIFFYNIGGKIFYIYVDAIYSEGVVCEDM